MKKYLPKITWKEIIYLFVIGCFAGYILETSFHLLKYHHFINKQGLLYGPFKPIYGIGLILFTMLLKPINNKSKIYIFFIGCISGCAFEYLCACFQEQVFGTYTWNYAAYPLTLQDKVFIPYAIFWGILGLVWIKTIYPSFTKLINNVPKKLDKVLIITLSIFMVLNCVLTSYATLRKSERERNIAPRVFTDKIIDKWYPDEVMNKKFPTLEVYK